MGKITDEEADKAIRDVEDVIPKRKKRLDISNALSYIVRVLIIHKKGTKKMESKKINKNSKTNKTKVNYKHWIASLAASPFIVMGVASLFESNVAHAEHVIGGIVAAFFLYVILEK